MIFESRNVIYNMGVSNQDFFRDNKSGEYFEINYFREGISDIDLFNSRKSVSLKCNNINDFVQQNNFIINNFKTNANKYNHYYIIDGNYRKDFYFNTETQSFNTMRRGRIFGNINLKSCGVESYSDLQMIVYRQPERQYIGIYPVTAEGTYNIPNLDVNSKYDIILYDTKRKIEQQVHSFREPTETEIPTISASRPYNVNLKIRNQYLEISYNIDKELYKDYEYCRLVYVGTDGRSYEILRDRAFTKKLEISLYSTQVKYGFYKVESVYKEFVESSDLVEIKEPSSSFEIIIPDETYTPPLGDNINIIVGE